MPKLNVVVGLFLLIILTACREVDVVTDDSSSSSDGVGGSTSATTTTSESSVSSTGVGGEDVGGMVAVKGSDPENSITEFSVRYDEDFVFFGAVGFTGEEKDITVSSIRLTWQGTGSPTEIIGLRIYTEEGVSLPQGMVKTFGEDGTVTFDTSSFVVHPGQYRYIAVEASFAGSPGSTHSLTVASAADITTNGTVSGVFPLIEPTVTLTDCQPEVQLTVIQAANAAYAPGEHDAFLWRMQIDSRCTDLEIEAVSIGLNSNFGTDNGGFCSGACTLPGEWNFQNVKLVNPYNGQVYRGPVVPKMLAGAVRLDFTDSFDLYVNTGVVLDVTSDIANPLVTDTDWFEYLAFQLFIQAWSEKTQSHAFLTVMYDPAYSVQHFTIE